MDSGLTETYLHLLAGAEFERASAPGAAPPWPGAGNVTQGGSRAALGAAAEAAAGLGDGLQAGEVTRLTASVLVAAGAISHPAAATVAGNLDAALAARHPAPDTACRRVRHRPPGWPLLIPSPPPGQAPGEPAAGELRVMPLTARLTVQVAGQPVDAELLACAQGPAVVIFTARVRPGDMSDSPLVLEAADDQGRQYQIVFQASDSEEALQEGQLVPPPPAPGLRWLEVRTGTGQEPHRVDLSAPDGPAAAQPQQAPARSPGELLTDAAAASLLAAALMPVPGGNAAEAEAAGMGSVLIAFLALGLLPAGSPSLRHLTALCERLAISVSRQLPGLAGMRAELPKYQEAALADSLRRDGPRGIARLAVALPAIDGARIALTAVESLPDRATLHLLALGWDPPGYDLRAFSGAGDPPLLWQAQDDTGRWHALSGSNWSSHRHQAWSGQLQLRPPLHPAATALELTITGKTGQQRTALPLHWHTAQQ